MPAHELACPCCGAARQRIGQETSEQLDYIPASLFVVEHIRPKYACKACEANVIVADKPTQPIEKGLAGPGLLAQTIVSKFCDHLPLYRLERIYKRHGIEIPRSTTCDWMRRSAELLLPLYDLMHQRVLQSKVLHTDDTPVPVQDKNRDRTKTGRFWVYLGDADHALTVFDYTPDRTSNGPIKFLHRYGGFAGYLQADAYAGYDVIYEKGTPAGRVIEVACWAHTRRKFYEARATAPGPAHNAMARIRQLYKVESHVKELDATQRYAQRQAEALPVLNDMRTWLLEQKAIALPKSPIGQAISYTLSNWDALCRYAHDGDLTIDNNPAENALRGIAIGRKNYLFMGSDRGGRTAAVLYSFVRSCERHHIDPFAYLRDVIRRISDTPISQLASLLPNHWQTPPAAPDPTASPSIL